MGILQTSVSGMKAQANRLGTVAQNIANVSTVGYKRSSTEFSDLVLSSGANTQSGGGVQTHVRNAISEAGGFQSTASTTDLAINGNGFFVVEDARGQTFLTRAGSFVPDSEGYLVNSAGYYLLGQALVNDDINPGLTLNSLDGLTRVNVNAVSMRASPSTQGVFSANVDARADVAGTGTPPTLVQDFGNADLALGGTITLAFTGTHAGDSGAITFTSGADLLAQLQALGGVASATLTGNQLTVVGATPGSAETLDIPAVAGLMADAITPSTATAVNAPASGTGTVGTFPSGNLATATYTSKSSMVVYDNLGGAVTLDIYLTKTGANTWEVSVFNKAGAAAGGGFPYAPGPLQTSTVTFDTFGTVANITPAMAFTIPDGQPFTIDLSGLTQLKKEFTPLVADANGNAPGSVSGVTISENGVVSLAMEDGSTKTAYRIAIANVPSPDLMTVVSGDVFRPNLESGQVFVGFPSAGVFGKIASSTLEASNVDLADELATMIEAQRNYTANSKSFQTGSDILDVLVNLKR